MHNLQITILPSNMVARLTKLGQGCLLGLLNKFGVVSSTLLWPQCGVTLSYSGAGFEERDDLR